ncbi:hypothetical protein VT84_10295 [Gemmata sp. SH-PL17]|uniref:DUF3500 domain-containing protein n=1 Tax=Gemmata sp. SH-PL17 TaxID=1630693 RepID=UPI00078D1002|nr:DUF3500 domain-containing protein [Gemmata sp. SH-PL17]AMV24776.1 hypothetical protein VT84_10295 [Gemmata sp. SH-PL17]
MMPAESNLSCPDCESAPVSSTPSHAEPNLSLGRRDFIRVLGTAAAVAVTGGLTPLQKARAARAEKQAQAEAMIFELFKSMDADQKKKLVRPYHFTESGKGLPARLLTHNAADGKSRIGDEYTKKQVELLDRIFRAIGNGEEGYKQLSRNGRFDASNDFETIGALIYGEAVEGKKFSLVFCGHHLTVRCDGNSEEKTAFGGPLYYGHSPSGYATTNVFYKQTKSANELFGALSAEQRKTAVLPGKWKDEHAGVPVPGKGSTVPGLGFADMTRDQKELTQKVMAELVAPYRKEDGDEVMEIIKANGGMEKLAMAFYQEGKINDKEPWSHWRLEGPGFVWSYRALPHVHTFVNITSKLS